MIRPDQDAKTVFARMCCRRMVLGYVDVVSAQVEYGNTNKELAPGVTLRRQVVHARTVSCD